MTKEYKELTFTDDFVFGKVLTTNTELCKELLELILDKKIADIKYVESQKTLKQTYESKGIRLDVLVENENTIYDIEMQTTFQKDLPKRARYYQGMIDLNLIESGMNYERLKKSYIIFICTKDPFGKGFPVYSSKTVFREDESIIYDDMTRVIFLNAAGSRTGLSQNMCAFLDFLQNQKVSNNLTEKLASEVLRVKENKKWSVEYMNMATLLADTSREREILGSIKALLRQKFGREQICADIKEEFRLNDAEIEDYIAQAKKELNNRK